MQKFFQINPSVMRIIELSCGLVLFFHLTTVFYWYIVRDVIGLGSDMGTWVPDEALLHEDLKIQYLHALTWAVMIVRGVGANGTPIIPDGVVQYVVSVIGIVTGMVIDVFLISALTAALESLNARDQERLLKEASLHSYLSSRRSHN